MERKYLDIIEVFICLSEKEVAALAFPTINNRLDYTGFRASDGKSRIWVENLFKHYWGIATISRY